MSQNGWASGDDAGKKIRVRKWHMAVDAESFPIARYMFTLSIYRTGTERRKSCSDGLCSVYPNAQTIGASDPCTRSRSQLNDARGVHCELRVSELKKLSVATLAEQA